MAQLDPAPTFSTGRRLAIGTNVTVGVLLVLVIVVMVNYLGHRYFWRGSLANDARVRLSPLTERVVKGLTNQMEIVIFFDHEEPLYHPVQRLLNEYRNLNSKVVVKSVDYVRNPVGARLAIAKYKLLASAEKDFVLFESGGRHQVVHARELSDYDYADLISGKSSEVKRKAFRGEQLFTSAILNVGNSRQAKTYFLSGHGEHSPEEKTEEMGYGKVASILESSNVEWSRLSLQGTNDIPSDCSLLIIAGPKTALAEPELERVSKYLDQGGRLMVLFNFFAGRNRTGLEKILQRWQVEVGDNVIFEPKNTITSNDVVTSFYGETPHPIVKELVPERYAIQLWLPRSIGPARPTSGGEAPTVSVLVTSSPEASEVTDIQGKVSYPNPSRDRKGTFPLIVAVEKGIQGVERGTTRIVVAGDSMFLANRTLSDPNYYFAGFAVNWLLAREELLAGIGPRPVKEFTLSMTKSQMKALRWIFLAVMPGTVLLFGWGVWLRRRL